MINLNFFPRVFETESHYIAHANFKLLPPASASLVAKHLYFSVIPSNTLFIQVQGCVTEILPLTLIKGFNMFMTHTHMYIHTYMIKYMLC